MKIITIAAAMALAATPALVLTQAPSSFERSSVSRESRAMRADLGGPRAGPDAPELRQGDRADSLYRRGREAMNLDDWRAPDGVQNAVVNHRRTCLAGETQFPGVGGRL